MNYIKNERDEKIIELKNIFKQMEQFETNPVFPTTPSQKGSITPEYQDFSNKRVHINQLSLFSIATGKSQSTTVSAEKS